MRHRVLFGLVLTAVVAVWSGGVDRIVDWFVSPPPPALANLDSSDFAAILRNQNTDDPRSYLPADKLGPAVGTDDRSLDTIWALAVQHARVRDQVGTRIRSIAIIGGMIALALISARVGYRLHDPLLIVVLPFMAPWFITKMVWRWTSPDRYWEDPTLVEQRVGLGRGVLEIVTTTAFVVALGLLSMYMGSR